MTRRRLLRRLKGATIREVTRRAKHAVHRARRAPADRAAGDDRLARGARPTARPARTARYAVLRAPLDDGRELVYRDVRRLGTLLLLDDRRLGRATPPPSGPSRWTPDSRPSGSARALGRSRQAIKKVIMDQTAAGRGGKHLRQRGAVRGGDRPLEARAPPHARMSIAGCIAEIRRILRPAIASSGTTVPRLPHRHRRAGQLPARAPGLRPRGRAVPPLRHPPHRHARDRRAGSPSSATAANREPLPPHPARRARSPPPISGQLRGRVRAQAENRPGGLPDGGRARAGSSTSARPSGSAPGCSPTSAPSIRTTRRRGSCTPRATSPGTTYPASSPPTWASCARSGATGPTSTTAAT